jgi:hypothetical protein
MHHLAQTPNLKISGLFAELVVGPAKDRTRRLTPRNDVEMIETNDTARWN